MADAAVNKLEKCEVCGANKAKYTCPKCEVRTCCLECVNIHKKELECDGIRDRTKFIPLNKFTDLDLVSDYRMLEEIGRSVEQYKKNPLKRCTKYRTLPLRLHKLKLAASKKGIFLHLMPHNFSRHKENTTYLNFKTNEIFWRIEWIFPQAQHFKWISERISENAIIADVLSDIWNPIDENSTDTDFETLNEKLALRDKLQYYHAANFPGIKILLKAEKVENCKQRFFELSAETSFQENFIKRNIVEFPTIYVVMKNHSDMYEIIDTDDEISFKKEEDNEDQNETLNKKRKFMKPTRQKRLMKKNNWKSNECNTKPENTISQKKSPKDETPNYFFNGDVSDSDVDM